MLIPNELTAKIWRVNLGIIPEVVEFNGFRFLMTENPLHSDEEQSLRKRTAEPITEPDRQCEDISYWNDVLASHGLGLSEGSPSRRKVSHIGSMKNLEGLEEEEFRKSDGRVYPSGKPPIK